MKRISMGAAFVILVLCNSALAQESTYFLHNIGAIDNYLSSDFVGGGLDNEELKVGGWGDFYDTLIKFDVSSLPSSVDSVQLHLYTQVRNDRSPVSMSLDRVDSPWESSTRWADRPQYTAIRELAAPSYGSWYIIDITDLYRSWKSGASNNQGIQLRPSDNNRHMNLFNSSQYMGDSSLRPKLVISQSNTTVPPPSEGWVRVSGQVMRGSQPVCALVLANGQNMFTCDGQGRFNLNVPLDQNGQVTLFAFASGFAPFREVLTPGQALDTTVDMTYAGSPPQLQVGYSSNSLDGQNRSVVSGTISKDNTPVCALVLANGQHIFSCDQSLGQFSLNVPLDASGNITLFAFASGFAPYRTTISSSNSGNASQLYFVSSRGTVGEVDTGTGEVISTLSAGSGYQSEDVAFGVDGMYAITALGALYKTEIEQLGSGSGSLTGDPARFIGNTGVSLVDDLLFRDGNLYGVNVSDEFYEFNTQTGFGTFLFDTNDYDTFGEDAYSLDAATTGPDGDIYGAYSSRDGVELFKIDMGTGFKSESTFYSVSGVPNVPPLVDVAYVNGEFIGLDDQKRLFRFDESSQTVSPYAAIDSSAIHLLGLASR